MLWCPRCKKEFDTDVTVCSICGTDLVDESKKYNYETVAYLEKDLASRLIELLQFSEIPEAIMVFDPLSENYIVQIDQIHHQRAINLVEIFRENELDPENQKQSENPGDSGSAGSVDNSGDSVDSGSADNDKDSVETDLDSKSESAENKASASKAYTKAGDRYKDNLSCAYTFLSCGSFGILLLLLENLGVINFFGMTAISKIVSNTVLGILFIVFIGIGARALRYSKDLKVQAGEEEAFTNQLIEWMRTNISLESIENAYSSEIPEEVKYFRRIEVIKQKLDESYPDLDEDYVTKIADDYYSELFS